MVLLRNGRGRRVLSVAAVRDSPFQDLLPGVNVVGSWAESGRGAAGPAEHFPARQVNPSSRGSRTAIPSPDRDPALKP
ncbi:hypothetical protein EBF04_16065 [Streptomyces sp. I6]|nr:hypothetical protein EBF04_16065 [Streptomyces sp. I6]